MAWRYVTMCACIWKLLILHNKLSRVYYMFYTLQYQEVKSTKAGSESKKILLIICG